MDPLHAFIHKVLQEGSSNRCPRTSIVGIAEQVRPLALQELLVLFFERHNPSAFEHLLTRRLKQFAEFDGVAEYSREAMAEADDDGVGESGEFN